MGCFEGFVEVGRRFGVMVERKCGRDANHGSSGLISNLINLLTTFSARLGTAISVLLNVVQVSILTIEGANIPAMSFHNLPEIKAIDLDLNTPIGMREFKINMSFQTSRDTPFRNHK
jgi:hypothetical protein